MKHNFVGTALYILLEALTPVIADRVGENGTLFVEVGCCDRSTNTGKALQSMLRVAVPVVICTIATGRRKGAVNWMIRDGVHREDVSDVFLWTARRSISMTFE